MRHIWLAALLLLVGLAPHAHAQAATAPATQPRRLSLLSYNILYDETHAKLRLAPLLKILGDSDADFIALQEVRPWHLKALQQEAWFRKYQQIPEGLERPAGGLVILSKLKPVATLFRDLPSERKRGVLIARYVIDGRRLSVANVHLESPLEAGETRAKQLKQVFPLIRGSDDAVLIGDYNFQDDWQPETAALEKGYVDVWIVARPDATPAEGFTWNMEVSPLARANSFPHEKSGRLDRVLIRSSAWKPVDARVLGNKPVDNWNVDVFPSDHFGLMGVIERK
jgi:tyrosyl-DNA phosphodiesterase 2